MTSNEARGGASTPPIGLPGSVTHSATDPVGDVAEVRDGVYEAVHDMSRDGLCTTIALALAGVTDVDPTELVSNFSRYADPDGLNRLFRHRPDGEPRVGGAIELSIEGHRVRVDSSGRIEIEPDAAVRAGKGSR